MRAAASPALQEDTRYHLLINRKSGAVLNAGEDGVQQLVARSGMVVASVHLIDGNRFEGLIPSLLAQGEGVIVGGGDGTIAGCLPHFIAHKQPMGVLPLGTMNLLARDLGFSGNLDEALGQYANGPLAVTEIDVAYVNDIPFLCCAGLGTMPESAKFRESRREDSALVLYPRLIKFIFDQMDPRKQRRVTLDLDGRRKHIKTAAIVVSNNLFRHDEDTVEERGDALGRASLQDGKLGVYSFAPRNWREKTAMVLRLKFGGWKNENRLREWQAAEVLLDDAAYKELVSIDGEVRELTMPLRFRIEPRVLRVLVPAHKGTG